MNHSPSLLQSSGALLLAALLSLMVAARGAENAEPAKAKARAPSSELLISKGSIVQPNGERVPATLRNVVDLITSRYPRANITLVGAEDIVVGDVTLRWSRRSEITEPSPRSLLEALKVASQHRFDVESFGDFEFLLHAQIQHHSRRFAEVFKVGPLLNGRPADPGLQPAIGHTAMEIAVASKRLGTDTHPTLSELKARLEELKRQQARATKPPENAEKILGQIQEVVRATLERLKPGTPSPDFQYHAGTGLLIVIGSDEAIDVTRKVVAAMLQF